MHLKLVTRSSTWIHKRGNEFRELEVEGDYFTVFWLVLEYFITTLSSLHFIVLAVIFIFFSTFLQVASLRIIQIFWTAAQLLTKKTEEAEQSPLQLILFNVSELHIPNIEQPIH